MPALSPESKRRLADLIRKHRLEPARRAVTAVTEECIALFRGRRGAGAVGSSHIGGSPDLPPDLPWPRTAEGKAYGFIAQLNLAELPRTHRDPLPETGMLYFFVGTDEPAVDVDCRFLYHDGPLSELARRRAPPVAEMENEYFARLKPFRLEARLGLSIPGYGSPDMPAVEELVPAEEGEALDPLSRFLNLEQEARSGVKRGHFIGQVLGNPDQIDGEVRRDAFLIRNGHSDLIYSTHEELAEIRKELARARRERDAEAAASLKQQLEGLTWFHANYPTQGRKWRALLSVHSDFSVGFNVWDAGFFTALIHERDLRARDFSRVYLGVESS